MALSTDEGAHVLVGLLGDILTTTSESLVESGTCGLEIHCTSIVAVGAPDGIHDLWPPLAPGSLVELGDTLLPHHARYIRALTGPASTGLYILIVTDTGRPRSQDFLHILDGMLVPPWSVVLHREGIAGP